MSLHTETLRTVARMLSADYGINITIGHTKSCCVDRKTNTIHLPDLPEIIEDGKLISSVRAWIDHEVGHITGDTSDASMDRMVKKHGDLGRCAINALEDVRVNEIMETSFAGCRNNLSLSDETVLAKIGDTDLKAHLATLTPEEQEETTNQTLCVGAYYAARIGRYPAELDIGHPAQAHINAKAAELHDAIEQSKSTEELEALADSLCALIKDPPEEQPEGGEGEDEDDNEQDESGDGDGDGEGEGDGEGGDDQSGEGSGGEGDGDSDGDKQKGDGSGQGDGEGDGDGDPKEGDVDSTGDPGDGGGHVGGDGKPIDLKDGVSGAIASDIEEASEEDAEAKKAQGYSGYDVSIRPRRDEDDIVISKELKRVSNPAVFCRNVQKLVDGAGGSLRKLLVSEGKTRVRRRMSSGTVDPRAIIKHAAGLKSPRIFTRTAREEKSPAAVSILLDCSGSMCTGVDGPKGMDSILKISAVAATAVSCAVDRAGHSSSIVLYGWQCKPSLDTIEDMHSRGLMDRGDANYERGYREKLDAAVQNNNHPAMRHQLGRAGYSDANEQYRTECAFVQVVKQFNKRMSPRTVANMAGLTSHYTSGCTPTGSAMYPTAKLLMQREEKRKVLLVITDGGANEMGRMKRTCLMMHECIASGIKPVVLMIGGRAASIARTIRGYGDTPTDQSVILSYGENLQKISPLFIPVEDITTLPKRLEEATKAALNIQHR